jgi:hypothetical protein
MAGRRPSPMPPTGALPAALPAGYVELIKRCWGQECARLFHLSQHRARYAYIGHLRRRTLATLFIADDRLVLPSPSFLFGDRHSIFAGLRRGPLSRRRWWSWSGCGRERGQLTNQSITSQSPNHQSAFRRLLGGRKGGGGVLRDVETRRRGGGGPACLLLLLAGVVLVRSFLLTSSSHEIFKNNKTYHHHPSVADDDPTTDDRSN